MHQISMLISQNISCWLLLHYFLLKQTHPAGVLFSQMNCTGDATTDRLLGHCYGNVAGHPVEVRASRSYRPHKRLCYGLSLTHFNLSAQAKGCYSSSGQKELRANLTHSVLLLSSLGLPTNSGLRFLLRPGPLRRALGIGLVVGPWRMDLNVGLRSERAGLYGWHGLVVYGTHSITHKAEVTGRMRLERWCHIWADFSVASGSVSASLLVSLRCKGLGRLVWVQVGHGEGGLSHKTSLTIHGQAGKGGLKASLGIEHQQDSLQCLLSVLLKDRKAEVGWNLQHQWPSLASIIPEKVDLQGSGQLHEASISGNARVSFNTSSAQMDIAAAWEPLTSFMVTLQHNMATLMAARVPEALTVSLLSRANQAQLEVDSDVCSVLVLGSKARGGEARRSSWSVFVHQRCVALKVRQETLGQQKVSGNMFPSRRKRTETSSHWRWLFSFHVTTNYFNHTDTV